MAAAARPVATGVATGGGDQLWQPVVATSCEIVVLFGGGVLDDWMIVFLFVNIVLLLTVLSLCPRIFLSCCPSLPTLSSCASVPPQNSPQTR